MAFLSGFRDNWVFCEVSALRLTLNLGAMVSSFSGTWLKMVAGKG